MRKFNLKDCNQRDNGYGLAKRCFQRFRNFDTAIATALEIPTSLRPEASLLLELYDAELQGNQLTVSALGLVNGIAPTTAIRYIALLEENGALRRESHESDRRMSYVSLTYEAKQAIEDAIQSAASTNSKFLELG